MYKGIFFTVIAHKYKNVIMIFDVQLPSVINMFDTCVVQVKTSQDLNHKLKEDLLHSRREYNRIHRCITFNIFFCIIS